MQVNLTCPQLEELIGWEAASRLWEIAERELATTGEEPGGEQLRGLRTSAEGPLSEISASGGEQSGNRARPHEALRASEIFVRRYTPVSRPWFPFHQDRAALTINVCLSDDCEHGGGRLLCIYGGEVHRLERLQGAATVHSASLLHAVSRMTSGRRYSLILFFGKDQQRQQQMRRFEDQVQQMTSQSTMARPTPRPGLTDT